MAIDASRGRAGLQLAALPPRRPGLPDSSFDQPEEDIQSSTLPVQDDTLEKLLCGCDEIYRANDKLRLSQAQWVEQAYSWLYSQQGVIPPQLDSSLLASSISFPKFSFSQTGAKHISTQSTLQTKKSNSSTYNAAERVDSAKAVAGDESRSSAMAGSVKTLKDHESRLKANALDVSIQIQGQSVSGRTVRQKRHLYRLEDVQALFRELIDSTVFRLAIVLAIFSNVIFVGVEVEYLAHSSDKSDIVIFENIQLIYTVLFFLELCCRFCAYGRIFFTSRRDWAWNWFDLFVVASAIIDAVATSSAVDVTHFRFIRLIRITRLLRTMRVLKMVRFIRALRTLVQSIAVTLRHVVWSLLLLLMILYGFGVAFAQAVLDACGITAKGDKHEVCDNSTALQTFWGTLPNAMFTLYKCVSGGINWGEVVRDIGEISSVWVALFLIYITFTLFAVLNVVTGVFCQSAIESVQDDKEMAAMQLMANKGVYLEALDQLFDEIDSDHSDMITLDEFESSLEHEKVQAYFQSLEISSTDAWALFKLLDADGSGSIDRDEFLMGCIQFRGGAKAVDIAKMAYENKVIFNMLEDCMGHFDVQLSQVLDALREVGKVDSNREHSKGRVSPSSPGFLVLPTDGPERQITPASGSHAPPTPKFEMKHNKKRKGTLSSKDSDTNTKRGDRGDDVFKTQFSLFALTPQHKEGLAHIMKKDKPPESVDPSDDTATRATSAPL